MTNFLLRKRYILLFLCLSTLTFCIIYQNTNNAISTLLTTVESFSDSSKADNTLNKVSAILQSVHVQFAIRIITQLLNLYISAFLLLVFFKFWNCFLKHKINVNFGDIINAYYLSIYVYIINYILNDFFMLITKTSMDYHQSIYFVIYDLSVCLVSYIIISIFLKNKYKTLAPIISFFSLSMLVQSFFKIGGLFEWKIF